MYYVQTGRTKEKKIMEVRVFLFSQERERTSTMYNTHKEISLQGKKIHGHILE